MSKNKRLKIVPSRSIFVDVDDTILRWEKPGQSFKHHPDRVEMTMFGTTRYFLPMLGNIAKLKSFYERGYEVVVWSLSSKEWAEEAVKNLGLENYVDFCVSKPDFFLDDKEVTHYMLPEKRIYINETDD